MWIDANDLDDDQVLRSDLCIVGAGAAGITLARDLIGTPLQVILLESGGLELEEETQDLYEGTSSGLDGVKLRSDRLRQFGGSSQHWEGMCLPFQAEDFRRRDYVHNSGWPISLDTLQSYYERAHETLEVGRFVYDAATLAETEGQQTLPLDSDRVISRAYRLSPPTHLGQRSFFDNASNVDIYHHANLVELRLSPSLDHVAALRCATLQGKRFEVQPRLVVLATGGLENARLLLSSREQIPEGVANRSGNVGRYFMEHPHYYGGAYAVMPSGLSYAFYRTHTSTHEKQERIFGALALPARVREREGLLAATLSLQPSELKDAKVDSPIAAQKLPALLGSSSQDLKLARLTLRCEQSPYAESRITLGSERDALGLPRLDLRWQIHPDDKRSVRRTLELLGAELGRAGLGRLWFPLTHGEYAHSQRGGAHHMGTTRMGADPKTSVVDEHGRCHDVDNLYLAGSSVFVTGSDANPTLTLVALAHRLAEHLQSLP